MLVNEISEEESPQENIFSSEEPGQKKRDFSARLLNGAATFARYLAASVLSTCNYLASAGNLLVNLEGKLVKFGGSTNPVVNEVITGIATVANITVTSFTRVPANFRLILAKPKKDPYADQETIPLKKKPIRFKDLHWRGRIVYCINLPLSLLSCLFGPINIYYFSYTVIIGLIHLIRKVLPAPADTPDSEDAIRHMGSVIAISTLILLARVVNTVAYDLKIANENTLKIAKTLDEGELPVSWSLLLATSLINLPSTISVLLLSLNSTYKSLEHISAQLPFHIPHQALNIITNISTVSAVHGHLLKSAPSITNILNRNLNRLQGNPPQEISPISHATTIKVLFYAVSLASSLTDGFTGASSVADLFDEPHSPLALTAACISGASLAACGFALNRHGFFNTMAYQPVRSLDDLEAQQPLLDDEDIPQEENDRGEADMYIPPRTSSMNIADRASAQRKPHSFADQYLVGEDELPNSLSLTPVGKTY